MAIEYSVTDANLLNTMADRLLEPRSTTPTTGMFTQAQWIEALNESQNDFIKQTGIVVTHLGYSGDANTGISATAGVETVAMPQDMVDPLRVAWIGYDASDPTLVNQVIDLPREDSWALDATSAAWETDLANPPDAYNEGLPAQPAIYLSHPPSDIGKVDLLYVAAATTLSSTGIKLSIPDEFSPYVLWGALAKLLSKEGEAKDPGRAAYCEQRYNEGIALAKALLYLPFALATEM